MSALTEQIRVSKNIRPIGKSGEYAYSSPTSLIVPDTISERDMTADFVIVDEIEDREWDTIAPAGCQKYLNEYQRNPVVLLEHNALDPVGLSEDASGNFHFHITKGQILARCHFNTLPLRGEHLSEEVFNLVRKGVFRGASPGFLPIRAKKRGYGKDDGMDYIDWRITEWSITTQPVNQNALRMSLAGVRCKSLRNTLESLVLPKEKSLSVVGGLASPFKAKSMSKPKIASIEFDKATFADEAACVAWLDTHGYDASSCTPLPTSFVFKQRAGKIDGGQKSLGTGVMALQTKAFGKDDDEEKPKKPADKESKGKDDKSEKPKGKPDESETAGDEGGDDADGDIEADDAGDEGEETEGETPAEDETQFDPEKLKVEANNLVDMIAHFELACDHAERMKSESVKSPELFVKLHADATALVADLRAAYKDGFADVAMEAAIDERKSGAAAKEEMPADDAQPDEYKDAVKALQSERMGLDVTAKSLFQAAVA